MATNDKVHEVKLDAVERQWVKQAIATQRAVLVRKRNSEVDGSEIYGLRQREIAALDSLSVKF